MSGGVNLTGVPPAQMAAAAAAIIALQAQADAATFQEAILTTAMDGTVTWTYPVAYGAGVVPVVTGLAVGTAGSTDVINVQLDGNPTNTAAKFRVTRTALSVVALLGLTILSVPASVGATKIHALARLP